MWSTLSIAWSCASGASRNWAGWESCAAMSRALGEAELRLRRLDRVRQQVGDRHRAHPARNRRDRARTLRGRRELYVPDELPGRVAVDPDVDHRRSLLHPRAADHL